MAIADISQLKKIKWEVLVVDEAHRLKSAKSRLHQCLLFELHSTQRILLTGTPIQNDVTQLWALLHFLDPTSFGDSDEFLQEYTGGTGVGQLPPDAAHAIQLQNKLREYLLRRVKANVLKKLPPKTETVSQS
jgi:SNF2 family DNA or RNA helicase